MEISCTADQKTESEKLQAAAEQKTQREKLQAANEKFGCYRLLPLQQKVKRIAPKAPTLKWCATISRITPSGTVFVENIFAQSKKKIYEMLPTAPDLLYVVRNGRWLDEHSNLHEQVGVERVERSSRISG